MSDGRMFVYSLRVGRPVKRTNGERIWRSAIEKRTVDGPCELTPTGFDGDAVQETAVHGGPNKAILCYALAHYDFWRERLPRGPHEPGGFGENLTLAGLSEHEVCTGDRFAVGSAVIEVSQPREPCYKLGLFHDLKELPLIVRECGYAGFYCRVIRPGFVSAGDEVRLLARPHPTATIAHANRLIVQEPPDEQAIAALIAVPMLNESFCRSLRKRLAPERTSP